jgi:hypothetical protein
MSNPFEKLDASDISDQASDLEQLHLRVALQNQVLSRKVLGPKLAEKTDKKTGTSTVVCLCHFCDTVLNEVDPTKDNSQLPRFCDEDCRDDWQEEQNMLIRTGKIKGDYRSLPGLQGRVGSE